MFADQFEADGDDCIYRKYSKGAPIKVSAIERDRYIAEFNRFLKYWFWGGVAGIVILIIVATFYIAKFDAEPLDSSTWIGVFLILALSMIAYFWAWNIPAWELRGRGAVGAVRSRAEMRRRYLEKLSYGEIAAIAGALIAALLRLHAKENLLLGWNRAWLIFGVFGIAVFLILAFRKWRFERNKNSHSP